VADSNAYQNKGYQLCNYYIVAPHDTYVSLNISNIYGFMLSNHSKSPGHSANTQTSLTQASCLPKLEVFQVDRDGKEDKMRSICKLSSQVLKSQARSLRISYKWGPSQPPSGFTLTFNFYKHPGESVFISQNSIVCI